MKELLKGTKATTTTDCDRSTHSLQELVQPGRNCVFKNQEQLAADVKQLNSFPNLPVIFCYLQSIKRVIAIKY